MKWSNSGRGPDPVLRLGQGEEGCVLAGRIVRCCFYGTNMIDADLKGTTEVGCAEWQGGATEVVATAGWGKHE